MEGIWKIRLGQPAEEGLLTLTGACADETLLRKDTCPLGAAAIEWEQVRERLTA